MQILLSSLIVFYLGLYTNGNDVYSSYSSVYDPLKSLEWSDDRELSYITTVRLMNDDYHVYQYKRYPCQYFYTDQVQISHHNETVNQCVYNTATSNYEYRFQIHLSYRPIEPFILRNIAIQCKYVNCSLLSLDVKSIRIDWNEFALTQNMNCSFNPTAQYNINKTVNMLSEWIPLRCQSLAACNNSKHNIQQALSSNINLIYSSSYQLNKPYCSLEKNLLYIIEANFAQTNRLLEQLIDLMQQGFGKPDEREQVHMKEFVEHKWINSNSSSTINKTALSGEVQGTFKH